MAAFGPEDPTHLGAFYLQHLLNCSFKVLLFIKRIWSKFPSLLIPVCDASLMLGRTVQY